MCLKLIGHTYTHTCAMGVNIMLPGVLFYLSCLYFGKKGRSSLVLTIRYFFSLSLYPAHMARQMIPGIHGPIDTTIRSH